MIRFAPENDLVHFEFQFENLVLKLKGGSMGVAFFISHFVVHG